MILQLSQITFSDSCGCEWQYTGEEAYQAKCSWELLTDKDEWLKVSREMGYDYIRKSAVIAVEMEYEEVPEDTDELFKQLKEDLQK